MTSYPSMTFKLIIKTMLIITSIWPRFCLPAITMSLVKENSELSVYMDGEQQFSDIIPGSIGADYTER